MIIGIDAREGVREHRAGKGEYVYQLVSQLIRHSEHQFVLFIDADPPSSWMQPNVRGVGWKTGAILWQLKMWWYLETSRPVDVYFSPTSLILPALLRRVPVVTALMDFVSFIFPNQHNLKSVILEKMWMRRALKSSRELIAISESTKQDAMKLFKVSPDKISVIYLAPSLSPEEENYVLPEGKIILDVGTLEPRKNIERLVAAFNQVKSEIKEAKLILVGRWGWQSDSIKLAVTASPFSSDIHILNEINNAQKKSIYQQADVMVFPSLYEGFGLPPLEAMSLGVPVITSKVSSLPEVVGEAAILINPQSVEEIAEAIKRVLQNPELAAELKHKGLARAGLFSWTKTADQTLDVLTRIK